MKILKKLFGSKEIAPAPAVPEVVKPKVKRTPKPKVESPVKTAKESASSASLI